MSSTGAAQPLASRLSYAQCWEDWKVLTDALDVGPGDRVLSVASAGCNSIALALRGAQVVGIDLSPPQIALCELKLAAGTLPYDRFLVLMGLHVGAPLEVYGEIEHLLSRHARSFWQDHPQLLEQGVLGAGRFEQYLGNFTRKVLPLIHTKQRIRGLIDAKRPSDQRTWHDAH